MLAQKQEPLTPANLASTSFMQLEAGRVKEAWDFVAKQISMLEHTRLLLEKAQSKYVKQVNKGQKQVEITEGHEMWLNVKTRGSHNKVYGPLRKTISHYQMGVWWCV